PGIGPLCQIPWPGETRPSIDMVSVSATVPSEVKVAKPSAGVGAASAVSVLPVSVVGNTDFSPFAWRMRRWQQTRDENGRGCVQDRREVRRQGPEVGRRAPETVAV